MARIFPSSSLSRARAGGVPRSEGAIRDRGSAGGSGGEQDALQVFDELLKRGRGASIYSLTRALTAVARASPAAAVSCFNRMARAGKVTPTLPTYGILIDCCCRARGITCGKDSMASFNTADKGWAFPRVVYFNGDNCVMPPPDAFPVSITA
uniref:COBRA C-terminal domain-containing protein n=1 Tax=Leersia perrieri TaxID=77586 RepID=A0A0D9XL37_9ORYZ